MKSNIISRCAGTGVLVLAVLAGGCAPGSGTSKTNGSAASSSLSPNANVVLKNVSMSILAQNGMTIFSDANANSSLQLSGGTPYQLLIEAPGAPTYTTFQLKLTPLTPLLNPPSVVYNVLVGKNNLQVAGNGTYIMELKVISPNVTAAPKSYTANITCNEPNGAFTSGLNGSAISVTAGGGTNLYTYSAVGVTAAANGMAPYQCSWDLLGTGVQDTPFGDCNTPLSNQYVNYVGTHKVSVMVMDACGQTQWASNTANLGDPVPSMPGNVFIAGNVSGATGSLANDPRVSGVTYLATNDGGNNIVIPNYGGDSFTISAAQNYKMPSSQPFGISISVKGLTTTGSLSSGNLNVSATSAYIEKLTYTTDESGDQVPAVSLTSTSCQLTNQSAQVINVQGQPCGGGTTGDTNSATVEVWGNYSCTNLSNASGSASITGSFDGYYKMADNCSGGGGGGGGVAPLQL